MDAELALSINQYRGALIVFSNQSVFEDIHMIMPTLQILTLNLQNLNATFAFRSIWVNLPPSQNLEPLDPGLLLFERVGICYQRSRGVWKRWHHHWIPPAKAAQRMPSVTKTKSIGYKMQPSGLRFELQVSLRLYLDAPHAIICRSDGTY